MNVFIQSVFEGGAVVMPAVALMFGIGMLLVAIMGPGTAIDAYPNGWPVLLILKPLMMNIVPTNPLQYVFIFTLAAPLALYRGPLNVWGMGYGLAAVFLASGLNPGAVMGLLSTTFCLANILMAAAGAVLTLIDRKTKQARSFHIAGSRSEDITPIVRKNIAIVVVDEAGADKARFEISEAWPSKYHAADLNAKGNDVAIETMEIVNEGIKRVS